MTPASSAMAVSPFHTIEDIDNEKGPDSHRLVGCLMLLFLLLGGYSGGAAQLLGPAQAGNIARGGLGDRPSGKDETSAQAQSAVAASFRLSFIAHSAAHPLAAGIIAPITTAARPSPGAPA